MKDREIIEAMERCVSDDCSHCPFRDNEDRCMGITIEALHLIKKLKAQLEQPMQINEAAMQSHSEEIRKLNDQLCKVSMELERYQRECDEAQRELAFLRAVKATAEAFLGRKIDGQM